ncbi:hypothetical protein E6Q11_00580 [Candidatus Dojkabacteria bacterium]|uniref:Uncharacterized protein n=1 Tax=Candidatus Dojkabacteria bacterium TaxID=2099670 RepID=A0A5C7JAN9_9BACT|nr:MAG: hypothetical protein E6Q11_00580 [Candidatus Dojkabacteria bacterium]
MPKKTVKKKTGRPVRRKKSFFESLFSFSMPKMFAVVAAAVFLTLMFQFGNSSDLVLGTKTTADTLTQSQVDALPKVSNASSTPKYIKTQLWRDKNGNGVMDNYEDCLPKQYAFKIGSRQYSATQGSNCSYQYTINKSSNSCVEVRFVNTLSNYQFTAINYSDKKVKGKVVKNKSVTVCGFSGYGEGFGYAEVKFGVKAK